VKLCNVLYAAMWFFIACVSAVDIYWSVFLHEVLHETEMNPLGSYLIEIDDQKIAIFMALKSIGTSIVLGFLILIFGKHKKIAWGVISGVFICQLMLLLFLTEGFRVVRTADPLEYEAASEYQETTSKMTKGYLTK